MAYPKRKRKILTVKPLDTLTNSINSQVNPSHYKSHPSGIECIDVIEHMTLNVGNAIKYLWRAGLKSEEMTEVDLRKAIWYIEREIARLDKIKR